MSCSAETLFDRLNQHSVQIAKNGIIYLAQRNENCLNTYALGNRNIEVYKDITWLVIVSVSVIGIQVDDMERHCMERYGAS